MKKLFTIFGHIYPLNITPINGISKNAFAKSITLSQKFQKINISLFFKNSGIIPVVYEFCTLAEKIHNTVSELKIAGINRMDTYRCNHAYSNYTLRFTKTHLLKFTIPAISITEYKTNNSIPGTINMFRNKYQNTF
jgi:hypothetical protein